MKRAAMGISFVAIALLASSASAQQAGGASPAGAQPSGAQPAGTAKGGMSISATPSGATPNGTVDASAQQGNLPGQKANTAQPQQIDRTEKSIVVAVRDPEAKKRSVAIEWNPLSLVTLAKLSFNVELLAADHHVIMISPHYQWNRTEPVYKFADPSSQANEDATSRVGAQHFKALGGELGYRYYSGRGGMRGWFIGPSLIADAVWANPYRGPMRHYADLGLALDAGYQVIVADSFTIGLGGGIQGVLTTEKVPSQQFPAHTIANREINPRALLSFGWAF